MRGMEEDDRGAGRKPGLDFGRTWVFSGGRKREKKGCGLHLVFLFLLFFSFSREIKRGGERENQNIK